MIRKKSDPEEESEWEETRRKFAWSLSLGPILNQLGFVHLEAALLRAGTDPVLRSSHMESPLPAGTAAVTGSSCS